MLAAEGYPFSPVKGDVIEALAEDNDSQIVFHAGTKMNAEGRPVVSGGRVLCVVGLGDTLKQAAERAYDAVGRTSFRGMQFRRDIGYRALGR